MTNPKVFEFAKQVGLTPLALMDKIKEWQIPVKSHMAELTPEQLEQIQQKLNDKGGDSAPAKKTAVRKKAATATKAPAADGKTVVAKPTTVAKAGVKKKAVAPETPAVSTAAPVAKSSGGLVVRRKSKADEEAKAALEAKEEAEAAAAAAQDQDSDETETGEPNSRESALARAEALFKNASPEAVIEAATSEPVKEPTPVAAPVAATPAAPAPESLPRAAATPRPAAPAAAATAQPSALRSEPKTAVPARKKEVAIGMSGVTSDATPAIGARRNIVGKMDLSRMQAPPGTQRPGFGSRPSGPGGPPRPGGPGGAAGGFQNRSKGNLRTGFIQQAPLAAPAFPSTDDSRRFDKKRPTKGVPATGTEPSAKELEEQPPAFSAAEFRKREMVFQPKKKKGSLARPAMQTAKTTPAAHKRVVKVDGSMKVGDLGQLMGVKATELIKHLIKNGVMATINTELDFDTIALIAPEFSFEAQSVFKSAQDVVTETAFGDLEAEKVVRPPVVTIMGHVDHGKTSLLDAIRSANVVAGEAGGITQHIGAYQVTLDDGYKITFLDTPGHEAFTQMRARGANVTDIAIIVVSADDGVMPQTAEAINHAKAANVPMIVAINKIDKPGANPEKIKQQLTEYEVVPEEWGGTTIFCPVSALKKTGLKELLEQIRLLAEVGELKANPARSACGTVIESKVEKGRGPVATVLVQDGTLKVGQDIVAGWIVGRVKSLTNDRGERIDEAPPGMPVVVLGLSGVPQAGDKFDSVVDEKAAAEIAQIRKEDYDKSKRVTGKATLEEIFAKSKQGDLKTLPIILKADVAGSLEALNGMFAKLSTPEVLVKIIHSAVGGINENDVLLAATSGGMVIGFNVRPDGNASQEGKSRGIEIRTYSIVYELIDDMKKAMSGLLSPDVVEKVLGRAEVRNIFTVPKAGTIAGCFVADGKIQRSNMARLVRDGKIVYEGKISSLKRFKDDAREVATGFECGIGIENFNDVKVGDVIEAFVKEEVARSLEGPTANA